MNYPQIAPIVTTVSVYTLFQVLQNVGFTLADGLDVVYNPPVAMCSFVYTTIENISTLASLLEVAMIVTFVVPIFVVVISCSLSVFAILRVQLRKGSARHSSSQVALRRSRYKATMTIILFALVYGIFNIPLAIAWILQTIEVHNDEQFNFFSFDTSLYFTIFTRTLTVALNSALNPLLYVWRMPSFRVFVVAELRGLFSSHPRQKVSNTGTVYNNRNSNVSEEKVPRNRQLTAV